MKSKDALPWEVYEVGGMPERGHSFVQIPAEIGKWAVLPESHAQAFRELCRRVVKRDNFSGFAAQLWEEIFEGGRK